MPKGASSSSPWMFSWVSSPGSGRAASTVRVSALSLLSGQLRASWLIRRRKAWMFSSRMVKPAACSWPPKPSSRSPHCSRAENRGRQPLLRQEPLPRPFSRQIIKAGTP